jgi:hypothetical protein
MVKDMKGVNVLYDPMYLKAIMRILTGIAILVRS